MSHTPGPWKSEGWFIGTDEEDSQTIGYVDDHRNKRRRPEKEQLANARLMATAPELLEACEAALATLNQHRSELCGVYPELSVYAQLRSTIAKAKGE